MERYLLGDLPEAERSALEKEYFNDGRISMATEVEKSDGPYARVCSPRTRIGLKPYLAHAN